MIHQTPRTTMPPLGVGIDRSNPLNRGLVDCYLFNSPGFAFNLVRGVQPWAIFDAGGKMGAAPFGYGLRTDGTSTGGATVTSMAVPASPWTIEVYCYTRTTSAALRAVWRFADSGGNNFAVYQGSANAWSVLISGSVRATTIAAVVGKPVHLVFQDDSTILSNAANFYIDGVLRDNTAASASNASSVTMTIGRDAFNQNFAGTIAFFKVYSRLLAPEEIAYLSRNPFAFLQPQAGFNYFTDAIAVAAGQTPSPWWLQGAMGPMIVQ